MSDVNELKGDKTLIIVAHRHHPGELRSIIQV